MVDGQGEDVAVGLGPDAGHPPCVGEETNFSEVGSVGQAGRHFAVQHHDVDDTLLQSEFKFEALVSTLMDRPVVGDFCERPKKMLLFARLSIIFFGMKAVVSLL